MAPVDRPLRWLATGQQKMSGGVVAEREAQEDKQQTFNRHAALRFLKNASAAPIAAPINNGVHRMA